MQQQVKTQENIIQIIVFVAGNEEFGVPIEMVREIIKMSDITPIPNSLPFIKGIINVRGEIVMTIDIKSRFNLPRQDIAAKHIVVSKQEEGLFGLIVDEVVEVLRINQNEIQPTPKIVDNIQKKYISGVISHEDRLILLLNLAEVLTQKGHSK